MEMNQFGTTEEMVIQEIDDHGVRRMMAMDVKGLYLTQPEMVGRCMADVNRYGVDRADFKATLEALGYDIAEILKANHHRLAAPESPAAPGKKVNPIKASKRGH